MFAADPGAQDGNGNHGRAGVQREPGHPVVNGGGLAAPPCSFGKDADAAAGVERALAQLQRGTVARAVHRKLAGRREDPPEDPLEHFLFDEDVHGPRRCSEHHRPVQEAEVVAGEDDGPCCRNVFPAADCCPVDDVVQQPADRPAPRHGPGTRKGAPRLELARTAAAGVSHG
ncbi:hypothetical protein D9M72_422410 [compost metagenome]